MVVYGIRSLTHEEFFKMAQFLNKQDDEYCKEIVKKAIKEVVSHNGRFYVNSPVLHMLVLTYKRIIASL